MVQALALLIAIVVGLAAFIVFFTWWDRRQIQKNYAALQQALNGAIRAKSLTGQYKGLPFRIAYSPGSRQSTPTCMVSLEARVPAKLTVKQETAFDRSAKKKEFAVEVQTGAAEFDAKFFIDTREPDYAQVYLGDGGKRDAVAALLEGTPNASEVRIGPKGVGLLIASFSVSRLQPEEMKGILDRLIPLTEKIPTESASLTSRKLPSRFKPLLAAVIGIEVVGTAGTIAALTRYPPVDGGIVAFSLLFSVPLAAVFLYGSYRALKGESSAHNRFGILVALSLFAFAPAGVAVAAFVNGGEESAPPSVHSVPVIEKREVKGDDGTAYQLVYDSWRKQGEGDFQPVEKDVYDQAAVGDTLVFTERKGRLGFLWSAGFQVKPRR